MKKPVFVVLKKYFHVVSGYDTPFTPANSDIELFRSYEAAKECALSWCNTMARQVDVLCDCGALSEAASQCDNLVMQCVGYNCYGSLYVRIGADNYQKYVL